MAEEAGIDWNTLAGSGPRGQVIRQDVELALSTRQQLRAGGEPTVDVPLPLIPSTEEEFESIPLSGVRAIIAERMAQSHNQTAPVTLTAEADATELVEMRLRLAARDVGVSYNDLLIFILGRALREHPRLNASLDGEQIKLWRRIDIGLAVDTDRGLLVPVVRNADQKGLAQLAAETKHLAEQARSGKITPDLLRGGTFTLTNLGMLGVDAFTPIINLPETAILGVGRIKEKPAVHNGQIAIRHLMWLSLTFDHRSGRRRPGRALFGASGAVGGESLSVVGMRGGRTIKSNCRVVMQLGLMYTTLDEPGQSWGTQASWLVSARFHSHHAFRKDVP